jgi:hypothetical protein
LLLLTALPGLRPPSVIPLLFRLGAPRVSAASYEFSGRLSRFTYLASHCLPPMLSETGGAARKRRPELPGVLPSSSTRTIIQTPTVPLWPKSGVQWIQRGRPSPSPSSSARVSQRILAVTPLPSPRAARRSERTRLLPPMRLRNGDCRIPGTRRDGDVKRIRRDGAGRIKRY